jgi:hypothetical protein
MRLCVTRYIDLQRFRPHMTLLLLRRRVRPFAWSLSLAAVFVTARTPRLLSSLEYTHADLTLVFERRRTLPVPHHENFNNV